MNNHILTLIVFFSFIGTVLFGQTSDVQTGCKPLTVNFTAPSGSSSYYWDFKINGVISTLEKPQVTFTNTGVFDVEFRETKNGPLIGTIKITVIENFDLTIKADPLKACVGDEVMFIDSTVYPSEVASHTSSWDFGDGKTKDGSPVKHTYSTAGVYDIGLNVKTNLANCDATQIYKDYISIEKSPTPLFTTDPVSTITCQTPLDVKFFNKTPNLNANTYEWDMGNSKTYTSTNPDDQTYNEGAYEVKLIATSPNGCSASASKLIISGPPKPNFAVKDSVCINSEVQFVNKSLGLGDLSWDFGADAVPTTSMEKNPIVTFSKGGIVPVKLTITSPNGMCSADTTINIFVDDPDASFTRSPTFGCDLLTEISFTPTNQDAKSYGWIFGDMSQSTDKNPTVTYDERDNSMEYIEHGLHVYKTELTLVSKAGCLAVFTAVDTIFRPYAHFELDTAKGCAPLEVTISDLSKSSSDLISWEYDLGDGQMRTLTSSDTLKHTYTDPGTYDIWLQVENQKGCRDTSFHMTVNVGDMQNVSFTADPTTVCIGDVVHFEGNSMDPDPTEWHFETDNLRSSHCYPDSTMDWVFQSETGTFDVTMWAEYNGCFTTQKVADMITVNGPLAQIDYLIDCDHPNDVAFRDSSQQADNVVWYFGDGDSSMVANVVHHYDAVGDYTVILKAEGSTGCDPSFDTTLVCVRNLESIISLDNKVCYGNTYELNGAMSNDVDTRCHRGYTWYFKKNSRPITTDNDKKEFQFGVTGIDTLALEVRDINGCLDTSYHVLKVFKVEPEFTMDKSKICIPADVVFESTGVADTTILSDKWEFGDTETSILLGHSNPTHTYSTPTDSTIEVKLTVKDILGCESSITKEIEVYKPVSRIIPESSVICVGGDVVFTAADFTQEGSHLKYTWSSNGQTSTDNSPIFNYNTEGDFSVTMNFEEISTGCKGEEIGNVTVQDYPDAAITIVGDNVFCVGSNGVSLVSFKNGSVSNFPLNTFWDFGNGAVGKGEDVAGTYPRGTYDVKLVVATSANCADSTTMSIDVIGPIGDFDIDKDSICLGDTVTFTLKDTMDFGTYEWEVGDGSKKNGNPLTFTYGDAFDGLSSVNVVLTFVDKNGNCSTSAINPVYFRDVLADFERGLADIDFQKCEGEPVSFTSTSTGADVFNWDFRDGTTGSGEKIVHSFENSGIYEVKLSVENTEFGCTDEVEKTMMIDSLPTAMAIGDTICKNNVANLSILNPISNYTYTWESHDFAFIDNDGSEAITDTLRNAGTFQATVTVEDKASGCSAIIAVNVVVIEGLPIVMRTDTIYVGDKVTIQTGSNNYDFVWKQVTDSLVLKKEVKLDCYDCAQPTFTVPELGPDDTGDLVYEATVVSNGKCEEVNWRYTYIIITPNVRYPKVFTPNSDGKNDYFYPIFFNDASKEAATITDMKIFNRWGQKVYDNDNPKVGWDGTFKGKPQSQDVYLYIISGYFPGKQDHPFTKHGDLTLLR